MRPSDSISPSSDRRDEASAEALFEGEEITDILVRRQGRTLFLLGPAGPARELGFLPDPAEFPGPAEFPDPAPEREGGMGQKAGVFGRKTTEDEGKARGPARQRRKNLPVLIGAGVGPALAEIVARLERRHGRDFCLAVVDKETDILTAGRLRERFAHFPGIIWIDAAPAPAAIRELTRLQTEQGGPPLFPLLNPAYLRLDRDYYRAVHTACQASGTADFWERARYAKFRDEAPRLLLLTSKYFLMGEIIAACKRLGYPHHLLQVSDQEVGQSEFIEQLLSAVVTFKPDFVFTINHLGVDREGVLTGLLEKLRLPLASWFVDNPHLILYLFSRLVNPWTAIFTWDADNLASLNELGFVHVSYLPLGVDETRFTPPRGNPVFSGLPAAWDRRVAFVGNSMVEKVVQSLTRCQVPDELCQGCREVAAAFGQSSERSVGAFLQEFSPEIAARFNRIADIQCRLGYETAVTWEATRQYRLSCVQGIMPFAPLIVGDAGWHQLLGASLPWHYHHEMNYYSDLPHFYPCADINFNCTSKQMKGAVNQRVFDVPATASFLLTDYRAQVENLFEPGREIICYHSPEEATALAEEYLARPKARKAVALAARGRILREHTYARRVSELVRRMRAIYA